MKNIKKIDYLKKQVSIMEESLQCYGDLYNQDGNISDEEQCNLNLIMKNIDLVKLKLDALEKGIYRKKAKNVTVDIASEGAREINISFFMETVPKAFYIETLHQVMLKEYASAQKNFDFSIFGEHTTSSHFFLVAVFDADTKQYFKIPIPKSMRGSDYVDFNIEIDYKYGDGEKELVIMINGFSLGSDDGTERYWGKEVLEALEEESGDDKEDFIYLDGSSGLVEDGSVGSRKNRGEREAIRVCPLIVKRLLKEGTDKATGKINKKIIIVTHSKGAAYGEGFKTKLLKIFKAKYASLFIAPNKIEEVIDVTFNLDAHQSSSLNVKQTASPTIGIGHHGSMLGGAEATGDTVNIITNKPDHDNETFADELKQGLNQHNENSIEGNDKYHGYNHQIDGQVHYDGPDE